MMIRDGHGPHPWIRVSTTKNQLLGDGYYQDPTEALAWLDPATTVEVIPLRANEPCG